MIKGIGCDIIRAERLARPLESAHFVERIYTEAERKLLEAPGTRLMTAAGRWAAKEAVAKALGVGITGCPPENVSVERSASGAPVVRLSGAAAALLAPGDRIHLSISHDGDYAMAYAVWEGEER